MSLHHLFPASSYPVDEAPESIKKLLQHGEITTVLSGLICYFDVEVLLRLYPYCWEFFEQQSTLSVLSKSFKLDLDCKTFEKFLEEYDQKYATVRSYDYILITTDYDRRRSEEKIFLQAAEEGNILAVLEELKRGCDNYKDAMIYAGLGGNIKIVQMMMNRYEKSIGEYAFDTTSMFPPEEIRVHPNYIYSNQYPCYDLTMFFAADKGHIEIVKLMIEKGASDFEEGLYVASRNGHIDIAKLMIEKGAANYNFAMISASYEGQFEIVELMIEKGANDYNEALVGAASCERRGETEKGAMIASCEAYVKIVKLMLEKGANNYDEALEAAANGGCIEIAELIIKRGVTNINCAVENAADTGNIEMVEFLIMNGANAYDSIMDIAINNGDLKLVQYILENTPINFDFAMKAAINTSNEEIISMIETYKNRITN